MKKLLENAKSFFLSTIVDFANKLTEFIYALTEFIYAFRDWVAGSLAALCLIDYTTDEELLIYLLLMALFCITIRWANRKRRSTRFRNKQYVHEDERGNLYIKVEDLNEVVEFVYRIERGERL